MAELQGKNMGGLKINLGKQVFTSRVESPFWEV